MFSNLCKFINNRSTRQLCTSSSSHRQRRFNAVQLSNLTHKFIMKNTLPINRIEITGKKKPIISSSSLKPKRHPKEYFRISRLNKIFMEKITDIVSTSDIGSQVAGCGLEITQVHAQSGLSALHVYWNCSNKENEEKLNEILVRASGFISHELVTQGVLGRIPPLVFIRDDSLKNLIQVEKLLQMADFGHDHDPSQTFHPSPSAVIREVKRKKNHDSSQTDSDSEMNSPDDNTPYNPITLRQDVFGVNRDKIMDMVTKGIKSSKGMHRKSSNENIGFPNLRESGAFNKQFTPQCTYSRTGEIRKWASNYKRMLKKTKIKTTGIDNSSLNTSVFETGDEFDDGILDNCDFIEDFENYEDEN